MTHSITHAVVIGATGLVGHALITQLVQLEQCEKITAIVRVYHPEWSQYAKLEQQVVQDFLQLNAEQVLPCSHVFSCLGTTLKKAGSKAAFYQTDFGINAHFASLFAHTDAHYLLISAMAADANSVFFYNRVKGELENYIRRLDLAKVSILRPALLLGQRQEQRLLEQLGQRLYPKLARFIPQQFAYRPIEAMQVAKAMLGAAERQIEKFEIYDNLALQDNFKG